MSERVHRPTSDLLQTIDLLADLFPQAFFVYERRRLPLRVGVFQDLLDTGLFTGLEADLKIALRRYTDSLGYQRNLRANATRIDLNGEPAGTVTADQAQWAEKKVAAIYKRRAEALQRAAQKPAPIGPPKPKKLSLADLRAAAQARKAMSEAAQ
jgi:ProP effector